MAEVFQYQGLAEPVPIPSVPPMSMWNPEVPDLPVKKPVLSGAVIAATVLAMPVFIPVPSIVDTSQSQPRATVRANQPDQTVEPLVISASTLLPLPDTGQTKSTTLIRRIQSDCTVEPLLVSAISTFTPIPDTGQVQQRRPLRVELTQRIAEPPFQPTAVVVPTWVDAYQYQPMQRQNGITGVDGSAFLYTPPVVPPIGALIVVSKTGGGDVIRQRSSGDVIRKTGGVA